MHVPQRMCVSCRKRDEKCKLIRIVKIKDTPILDNEKYHDGRSIYVCKDEKCIDLLKKSNALQRFLGASANDNFYETLKGIK